MFKKIRNTIAKFISSNSMSLPGQFMKYGNRSNMLPGWENVVMSDEDHYTGLSYAAIRNRANSCVRIGKEFLRTMINGKPSDSETHPYIDLIRNSPYFSESMFWYWISTYLDLEGVFYLYVLRNNEGDRYGEPKYFKLLNPYNITRVMKADTLEVGVYVENRKGFVREIPASQIIEIRDMNPFDEDKPYAMTDAAREDSYTLKTAGDFTRQALRNNINAPGILTTDVVMEKGEFENFVARVRDHTKGEPLFGNGSGVIDYKDMGTDLTKAALEEVNKTSQTRLLAVSGVSKTVMGIEESGTTRETANVQTELMIANQTVPRLGLIVDTLNLDYKNKYKSEEGKGSILIEIENPIDSDQETEQKKVEIKQSEFDLFDSLVEAGYDEDLSAQYAQGEISLKDLGKPKNERRAPDTRPITVAPVSDKKSKKKAENLDADFLNDLQDDQQSTLQNAIVNVDQQLAVKAVNQVEKLVKKNEITKESDLIPKQTKEDAINDLVVVLMAFYAIIGSIRGREVAEQRAAEFGMTAKYLLDRIAKDGIRKTAEAVAESHVATVSEDLYKTARAAALEGKGQLAIISELKTKYAHAITDTRAKAVARSETNRAFTMAQHDADRQFIAQNNLEDRAYKQYETRSDNPCGFCKKIESEGLIPFDQPFRKIGDTVTAMIDGKEKTFHVKFQDVNAGNLHTNCSCIYRLVIKSK